MAPPGTRTGTIWCARYNDRNGYAEHVPRHVPGTRAGTTLLYQDNGRYNDHVPRFALVHPVGKKVSTLSKIRNAFFGDDVPGTCSVPHVFRTCIRYTSRYSFVGPGTRIGTRTGTRTGTRIGTRTHRCTGCATPRSTTR